MVGVSQPEQSYGDCEYCGLPITEDGQACAALDDGQCRTAEEVLAAMEGSA